MSFISEMNNMFIRLAECKLDVSTWEQWWNTHLNELKASLSPGDMLRIKLPVNKSINYYTMYQSQMGAKRYLEKYNIPYTDSDLYAELARNEQEDYERKIIQEDLKKIEPAHENWEKYKMQHGIQKYDFNEVFDINQVMGFCKEITPDQYRTPMERMKLSLKIQMDAKIAPLAKAYKMKRKSQNMFVREQNGIVTRIRFIGYFRGGGYENMITDIIPLYMPYSETMTNYCTIPFDRIYTERHDEVFEHENWSCIQFVRHNEAPTNEDTVKESKQFDRIVSYLALDILPEYEQITSLEVFFAPERLELIDVMRVGPLVKCGGLFKPSWNSPKRKELSQMDDYLFGVWNLINGRLEEGYHQLKSCLEHEESYLNFYKEYNGKYTPDPTDIRNYSECTMYHFAQDFYDTKNILDLNQRKAAIAEIYERVCSIMRKFYRL